MTQSDKTTRLYDEQGYFHCEDGPAIRYHDGAEAYYLHGELVFDDVLDNTHLFENLPYKIKRAIVDYKLRRFSGDI